MSEVIYNSEAVWKKRLQKEVARLIKSPVDGITCYPEDDSFAVLNATIRGPDGTPYEGGNFSVEITIPDKYPFRPPGIKFVTKIYHPNIDEQGRVCMDILKESIWVPSVTLEKVLQSLQCLLQSPNPNDALDAEIGGQYISDFDKFKKTAQSWTELYAAPGSATN